MNKQLVEPGFQRGAIDLIAIFAMLFFGLVILSAVKIAPIYIDHWTVKEALTAVIEEAGNERITSKKKIISKLRNRLMVNRIEFLEDENIKVERSTSQLLAQLNYERRVSFMFNIDAVIKFPETVAEAPLAAEAK